MKQLAQRLLPPIIYDSLRWCLQPAARRPKPEAIRFSGNYSHWEDAKRDSTGYAAPAILEQTRAAILKVKNREAAFERDAVLLPAPELPLPLLAGLLRAAAENAGRLHVLDFGGSLGSSYFQCRDFLAPLGDLRWSVVEQPAHVACGSRELADERLSFHADIPSVLADGQPDVLLLSSVLQFLPDPHAFLDEALSHRIKYVMVDRTFFHSGAQDRLTVQHVPAWIYRASYPAWFFSEPGFRAHFSAAYELVANFPAQDKPVITGNYVWAKGLIYRLRP